MLLKSFEYFQLVSFFFTLNIYLTNKLYLLAALVHGAYKLATRSAYLARHLPNVTQAPKMRPVLQLVVSKTHTVNAVYTVLLFKKIHHSLKSFLGINVLQLFPSDGTP